MDTPFAFVEYGVCRKRRKVMSKIMQKLQKSHPRLEGCPDYPRFGKAFSESLLDCFEEQLDQYIRMSEVSEEYLRDVPRIVCWYEGIIPTEDLIKEFEGY